MPDCDCCTKSYVSWAQHVRRNPACLTALQVGVLPAPLPTLPSLEFLGNTSLDIRHLWTSDTSLDISIETLQDQVARDLMDLRYKHGLSEPDIMHVKEACRRWSCEIATVTSQQLLAAGLIVPGATLENLRVAVNVNVFDGLETKEQEFAAAKRNLPYLEPRVVYPDGDKTGEPIVSFDLAELYYRRLNHDTAFRKKVVAKSDELKRGNKFKKHPDKLEDILDGVAARWHPHLHRPATEDEEHDVRIAQLVQVDDLELCNTLGVARGLHKQMGAQTACLNLSDAERFNMDNIMLTVLARASVYKKHGMTRVLSGVDKDGKQHDEVCHARDLQRLDKGVWMQIPDDRLGGMRWICLKVWTLTIAADDPAKKSLTPFVESCKAHRNCNVCSFHAKADTAGRPFSFLRAQGEPVPKKRLLDQPLRMRDSGAHLTSLTRTSHAPCSRAPGTHLIDAPHCCPSSLCHL